MTYLNKNNNEFILIIATILYFKNMNFARKIEIKNLRSILIFKKMHTLECVNSKNNL